MLLKKKLVQSKLLMLKSMLKTSKANLKFKKHRDLVRNKGYKFTKLILALHLKSKKEELAHTFVKF